MNALKELHFFRGMQVDVNPSKVSPLYYVDANNIRISARDDGTLYAITNELGTKEMIIQGEPMNNMRNETILNYTVLNLFVVLFTTDGTLDYIRRFEKKDGYFEHILLYKGNLNFKKSNAIESLSIYENENIQKVYWIDGINLARFINIVENKLRRDHWNDNSFNFVQHIKLEHNIEILRLDLTNGLFSSGVILYAFTYYNSYGQESNIFEVTPLLYLSYANRGASPEDKVSTSFIIKLNNLDITFDYLRVYSIHRASVDAEPSVTNVMDIAIPDNGLLQIEDTGTIGKTVDPTMLLYVGGEEVVFGTMAQKDNTLFLGNYKIKRNIIPQEILDKVKEEYIEYKPKFIKQDASKTGYYPYKNTLSQGLAIKTLKYLEWYRYGILFQHSTGKWSEPIFIEDSLNTRYPENTENYLYTTKAQYRLPSGLADTMVKMGYIRARGVIVYPTLADREIVAQGIVCPTVFNVSDRVTNSPFVLASWFSRPALPFDVEDAKKVDHLYILDSSKDYANTKVGIVMNTNFSKKFTPTSDRLYVDIANKGAWAEFRHHYPIPNNWEANSEIQCLCNVLKSTYTAESGSKLREVISKHQDNYFVDTSILTFHSPDIEFDTRVLNLDSSNLKMRIIGLVLFTSNASDIDILTSTLINNPDRAGFYKEGIGDENVSFHGLKSLIGGGFWMDTMVDAKNNQDGRTTCFRTYTFHRNGSLNNQGSTIEGKVRSAMLDKKKISNLKFSLRNQYLREPWYAEQENSDKYTGITPVVIFNSDENSLVRLESPKNSTLADINYYGNIDKVIVPTRYNELYLVKLSINDKDEDTYNFNKKHGYPIVINGTSTSDNALHELFIYPPFPLGALGDTSSNTNYGTDAVRMTYKSTPHAVFALNFTEDGRLRILPTTSEWLNGRWSGANFRGDVYHNHNAHPLWDKEALKTSLEYKPEFDLSFPYSQDILEDVLSGMNQNNNYGYLYLTELYRDNVPNRFGGNTPEAFEMNEWIPAGKPISLLKDKEVIDSPIIEYTEGDTYYLRYDCIKTYPKSLEELNGIIEIVSFMCETKVNLDGRYDRNRGQVSNLTITPENFNKINLGYSQIDNFFNYKGIDPNKFNLDLFPNSLTFTKEKQMGSLIDTWTNITLTSTLDLDGDKGEITSLNTFNNELFCFQLNALSNILFNSRVQIPASDGIPIEISNGMKLNGKRYISNTIGCNNKWSIAESPAGLYFIDNTTNSIYLFNGEITSLSDKLGFRSWISSHNKLEVWNPLDYNNFKTFYDKNNNDIYFTSKYTSLCYSEVLLQFTSFMSYENIPAMFNIESNFYSIKDGLIWLNFVGDYNMFYGLYKGYHITFMSNTNPMLDKTFNNIEFRSDTIDNNGFTNRLPFNELIVLNDYLLGISNLKDVRGVPSNIKKKFKIWRMNIPRSVDNKRDRIRNTWAMITLSNSQKTTLRIVLYDVVVGYFI